MKFKSVLMLIFGTIILIGCGGDGVESTAYSESIQEQKEKANDEFEAVYGVAQLGNLANARVEIFEIESDGNLTLKWEEITSEGDKLESIGKFNTHAQELKSDKFYLYRVKGGEDWDKDDDGEKDNSYSRNNGEIRVVAQGKDIAEVGDDLRVTAISEMLVRSIEKEMRYNFKESSFNDILREKSTSIIDTEDENQALDSILRFNPIKDKSKLNLINNLFLENFILDIRDNRPSSAINALKIILGEEEESNNSMTRGVSFSDYGVYSFLSEGSSGFKILDMNSPSTPEVIDKFNTSGYTFYVVPYIDGSMKSYIFVADGEEGLKIFDIFANDTSKSKLISTIETNSSTLHISISKDGTKLYVADGENGVKIIDVSTPYFPKVISQLNKGFAYSNKTLLSKDEKLLYASDTKNGVKIIDVSNPTNPVILSEIQGSFVTGFALSPSQNILYITDIDSIKIFDVSNPQNVEFLSSVSNLEFPNDIAVSFNGSTIYVAELFKGIAKIDVSDNRYPKSIGTIPLSSITTGVTIFKHFYYYNRTPDFNENRTPPDDERDFLAVANGKNGLVTIDIFETRFNGVE